MTTATKTIVKTEVTQDQIVKILFGQKFGQNTTTFIGFDSVTEPDMRKTGNRFHGNVDKESTVSALGFYQYARMVDNAQKRQLSAELIQTLLENGVEQSTIDSFNSNLDDIVESSHTQFESAGLQWGEYMIDPETDEKSRLLIDHTSKKGYRRYAQVAILNTQSPVYKWKESGTELTEAEISEMKTFFPTKKEGTRQGLRKPYIIRSYALDNVKAIRMNKNHYEIVG